MSKKIKFLCLFLIFAISALMLIPLNVFIVEVLGKTIFFEKISNNTIVSISHINSIYNAKVEEVFKINGKYFELIDVVTDSYGVKEYYGITEGVAKRRLKKVVFFNGQDRNFVLRVNNNEIKEINKFKEKEITLQIEEMPLFKFLFLMLTLEYEK